MANEADEGLKYKGRKASFVTRNSMSNRHSYYKVGASKRRAARTSLTCSMSHSALQGDIFGRRKNLQNRKTRTVKNFSHCRGMALYPGQEKGPST